MKKTPNLIDSEKFEKIFSKLKKDLYNQFQKKVGIFDPSRRAAQEKGTTGTIDLGISIKSVKAKARVKAQVRAKPVKFGPSGTVDLDDTDKPAKPVKFCPSGTVDLDDTDKPAKPIQIGPSGTVDLDNTDKPEKTVKYGPSGTVDLDETDKPEKKWFGPTKTVDLSITAKPTKKPKDQTKKKMACALTGPKESNFH